MYCLRWSLNSDSKVPVGLLVIFMLSFPILNFGSERRQRIGTFPVTTVIYGLK